MLHATRLCNEVVAWNARSLRSTAITPNNPTNRIALFAFLRNCAPIAVCLSETHFGKDHSLTIPHYTTAVRCDHKPGSSGVLILVRKDIRYTTPSRFLLPFDNTAAAAASITLHAPDRSSFILSAVYIPPNADRAAQLGVANYLRKLKPPTIADPTRVLAMGDFNCRDPIAALPPDPDPYAPFSCKTVPDPNHAVVQLVTNDDWHSLNAEFAPGVPTRPVSDAVLDLALTNAPEIVSNLTVGLPEGMLDTSDHTPIRCALSDFPEAPAPVNPPRKPDPNTFRFAFAKATADQLAAFAADLTAVDWEKDFATGKCFQTADAVDGLWKRLADPLHAALRKHIPRVRPPDPNRPPPDLPPDVQSAYEQAVAAHRKLKRAKTACRKELAQRPHSIAEADAVEQRHALTALAMDRTATRKTFRQLLRRRRNALELERVEKALAYADRGGRAIDFTALRRLTAAPRQGLGRVVDPNPGAANPHPTPETEQQSLENLHCHFDGVFAPPGARKATDFVRVPAPHPDPSFEFHCPEFTAAELDAAWPALHKGRAPGPDLVPYEAFRAAPKRWLSGLLRLFSLSVFAAHIPAVWRVSSAFPLHKGGCPDSPGSYRLIALEQTALKLLERLVNNRLRPIIDPKLTALQFGFRANHSTHDATTRLLSSIALNFRQHNTTVPVAFLDIKKAFDTVPHDLLHAAIAAPELAIPPVLIRWIAGAFLSDRSLYLTTGDASTTPRPVLRGVPQGAVLSPTLFVIYINSLAQRIAEAALSPTAYCDIVMYADDCAIVPRCGGADAVNALERALSAADDWGRAHGLVWGVGAGKSEVVVFRPNPVSIAPCRSTYAANRRAVEEAAKGGRFRLNNTILPVAGSYRHLGVWLTERLSSVKQFEVLRRRINMVSATLSRVARQRSAFQPTHIARLISVFAVPVVMFAAPYLDFTAAQLQSLTVAALQPLRVALKLPRSAHANSLCLDFGFLPFDIRCDLALGNIFRTSWDRVNAHPRPAQHPLAVLKEDMQITRSVPPALRTAKQLLSNRLIDLYDTGRLPTDHTTTLPDRRKEQLLADRFDWTDVPSNARFSPSDAQRRWGEPLKGCIAGGPRTSHSPTPKQRSDFFHHPTVFTTAPLFAAADIAAARYDTFSFWRQFKRRQRVTPHCPFCTSECANARHLIFHCPQFSHWRADAVRDLNTRQKRAFARIGTAHDLHPVEHGDTAAALWTLIARIRRYCRTGVT